ncbi:hypothetical protein HK096_011182, partial [Nowakowskiella sp. JEL0078]
QLVLKISCRNGAKYSSQIQMEDRVFICFQLDTDVILVGDVKMEISIKTLKNVKIGHFWFNTAFVTYPCLEATSTTTSFENETDDDEVSINTDDKSAIEVPSTSKTNIYETTSKTISFTKAEIDRITKKNKYNSNFKIDV